MRVSVLALATCLAACACSHPADHPQEGTMKKMGDDAPSGEFTRGPSITPSADLVTWLDGTNTDLGKRKVRLPVWIDVGPAGGVKAARIGAAEADAVKLKLNDSGLGISVADHVRRVVRAGGPPALWLEGQWNGGGRFSVLRVVKPIAADEADAATYVEVQ